MWECLCEKGFLGLFSVQGASKEKWIAVLQGHFGDVVTLKWYKWTVLPPSLHTEDRGSKVL
jgi:hypothetical protein